MRVLLISNMYPSKENPQFGIFVGNSEEILSRNGILIEKVVCTKKDGKISKLIQYLRFYVESLFKLLFYKYDYVYVHYLSFSGLPVIIAKKFRKKIKIISNVHGSDVIPQNAKHKALNGIAKICAEVSDTVIVPSLYFKKELKERWNINENKVVIFPSGGIDSKIFYPKNNKSEMLLRFGLDNKFKYIGFVGRLTKGKGWEVLLDAINKIKYKEELKEYKFIFVGDGDSKEEFKNKIELLGLEDLIIKINFLNHVELSNLYNCLDLFCFPTEMRESLGLVGIEAMACGVPVIVSDFAALKEYVVEEFNGYLFSKGNYIDLSEKILIYINSNTEKKKRMKENAYESSMKYRRENIENILINLFSDS